MSSIFAETIAKAISEYRQMLRRYLNQSDRMNRLHSLNLKDPTIYDSEVTLYQTAQAIVGDIENNANGSVNTYYSYSGIANFCQYLKEFLNHYELEDNHIVHKVQKAARALIQAIQLTNLPDERLNEAAAQKIRHCNALIAEYGSDDQCELHLDNLMRNRIRNETFYSPVLKDFQNLLSKRLEASNEGNREAA